MVGCADLIRGHPDAATAHVGLLLVAERHEGRGIGSAAFKELEALVRSWHSCSRLRLGVVRSNDRALRFWSRLGFTPTGEVKPYRYASVVSEIVVFDKPLPAGA
jgi:GNAT superfamily N-acetyltransferase